MVLGAATAGLLSGCIKLDVDLTVRPDDKVDGTLVVAVSKQVAAFLPGGAANLEQLVPGGDLQVNGAEDVQSAPYEDDDFTGRRITFIGAPLEEASAGTGRPGELTIKHEGSRYLLNGTLDLTVGDLSTLPPEVSQNINTEELFSTAVVRVHVTFPGKVEEANGEISGCSVTWQPKFGSETELRAIARDGGNCRDGLRWWAWPLFGLGLLVLIGAVIAIVHVLRKERRERSSKAGAPPVGTTGEAGLAPPQVGGLAPPAVEDLAPPTAEGLAPPTVQGLAPPAVAWPPPGSNVPPPPDEPTPDEPTPDQP